MLLATILILLVFGNWLLNETLIFIPINLLTRLTNWGWWGLAVTVLLFFAWCMGEDK